MKRLLFISIILMLTVVALAPAASAHGDSDVEQPLDCLTPLEIEALASAETVKLYPFPTADSSRFDFANYFYEWGNSKAQALMSMHVNQGEWLGYGDDQIYGINHGFANADLTSVNLYSIILIETNSYPIARFEVYGFDYTHILMIVQTKTYASGLDHNGKETLNSHSEHFGYHGMRCEAGGHRVYWADFDAVPFNLYRGV